jgi:cytochrome P450
MLSPLRSVRESVERTREFVGFVRDPLSALTRTKDKWGDVAVLPLPGPRLIQVTRPDHVSVLLRMQHRDTLATKSLRDLLGNGLITTDSDDVRPRRRLVGRPLTPKAIASYVDDMREQTAHWADAFSAGRAGESVEITSGLFALSMDMLIHSAFGAQISLDRPVFAAHLDAYMYEFYLDNTGWRRMLPPGLMTPGRRRRAGSVRGMQEMVQRSIAQRRTAEPGSDLLYVLMNARDEAGELLCDADLLDELLTMLIPGHETPALMLGYALWALAAHPEIQQRLHDELSAFDVLTAEAISSCRYLGAVVDESFRLYPPAYVIGREAREPMELGGLSVKPGDQLIAPQWVVHRDPRWWRSPEAFRPERWLNGETASLAPGTFFPFGGGQRSCLGGHFSRLMGQVVLGQLVRQLEVAPDPSYSLSFIQGPTLRPREGIRLRVAARPRRARTQAEARSVC